MQKTRMHRAIDAELAIVPFVRQAVADHLRVFTDIFFPEVFRMVEQILGDFGLEAMRGFRSVITGVLIPDEFIRQHADRCHVIRVAQCLIEGLIIPDAVENRAIRHDAAKIVAMRK